MPKLQAITLRPQFDAAIKGTREEVQRRFVAFAREQHSRVMRSDPRPASFLRTVDGVVGAREDAVRYDGIIIYDYPRIPSVVAFAMEKLIEKSPVESGAYRDSHTIFLNGEPVSNLKGYRPGDDVAISNLMPYTRKIELGKMKMRVAGTDHVYQQALQAITRSRFGGIAKVRLVYRPIFGGGTALERWASKTRTSAGGHRHGQSTYADWTRRQPTLVFSEK
jgi:hypothetical protein